MSVDRTAPPRLKRQYPHVDDITDWRAQQSIRLLWDRVFDLESRLQASEATVGDLVSASNSHEDDLQRVELKAAEALTTAQYVLGEVGYYGPTAPTGPLVWVWVDRGGNPPVAPGSPGGAPTTLDEWRVYFFGVLGKTLGEPADDYIAVLNAQIAAGMMVNFEVGEVPNVADPYYSIHLQCDSAGTPRGRVQLPTAVADGLGYYRHEVDIVGSA